MCMVGGVLRSSTARFLLLVRARYATVQESEYDSYSRVGTDRTLPPTD
jgi:hypothetical protein